MTLHPQVTCLQSLHQAILLLGHSVARLPAGTILGILLVVGALARLDSGGNNFGHVPMTRADLRKRALVRSLAVIDLHGLAMGGHNTIRVRWLSLRGALVGGVEVAIGASGAIGCSHNQWTLRLPNVHALLHQLLLLCLLSIVIEVEAIHLHEIILRHGNACLLVLLLLLSLLGSSVGEQCFVYF